MFKRTHQQINLLLSIRILCSFCVFIRKLCFCQKQWLSTIRNNIMLTWGELYPFGYFREKREEVYTIRKVHIHDTIGTIFNQWAADTNHTIGSEIWTTINACDPYNAQTQLPNCQSMLVTDVGDEMCWWWRCWRRFWPFWSPTSTILLLYIETPWPNYPKWHTTVK